jgi:hypothetical protein
MNITGHNSTYSKGGVSCSADIPIEIGSGKSPAHRVAPNRYLKTENSVLR